MKKNLTQFIKIAVVALVIGLGVSAASAWTAPGTGSVKTAPIDGNVAASINLGDFDQIKKGGIIIPVVNKKFVSPLAFFKKTLLPGKDSAVYIGGSGTADPDFTTEFPTTPTAPLTINLAQRADPTGAIQFKTAELCPVSTKLVNTNTAAFEFWNLDKNANADIIAKQIRLDGGKPGIGKILIAVDNKGRAVWATPKLATNGKDVIFDTHDDSPVGLCNNINPSNLTYTWVTVWSGCKYLDDGGGYMENPSSNICKDSNGNIAPDPSLCTQPVPGPRQAASSLPLCSAPASCQAYQLKANCTFGSSAVYIPNGCTKTTSVAGTCATGNAQEIYNIECSSPQTEQSISSGAAAAGFPSTHLNNQNPQQCSGPAPITAWYCHTAGVDQWVTAESRGQDIACTGPYLPTGTFTEGDIVCAQNKPGLSLCKENGSINSTCRPGDSVCPN